MASRKSVTFTCILFLVSPCYSCAACSSDLTRRKWQSNPLGEMRTEPVVKAEEEPSPSLPADLKSLADLLSTVAGESSQFIDPKWDSEEWDNSTIDSEEEDRDHRFSPAIISAVLPIMTHFMG